MARTRTQWHCLIPVDIESRPDIPDVDDLSHRLTSPMNEFAVAAAGAASVSRLRCTSFRDAKGMTCYRVFEDAQTPLPHLTLR
jgi:hypothetical protein